MAMVTHFANIISTHSSVKSFKNMYLLQVLILINVCDTSYLFVACDIAMF